MEKKHRIDINGGHMETAILLTIIASIIDLGGNTIYIRDIWTGRCRPSITSWGLWSFLAILHCCSYTIMTGDWIKAIIPIVSTTACVATLILALFKGSFNKLQKLDYWALAFGVIAALIWWTYKNATYGNLLLQPGALIGYIPTYKNVWKNSKSEKPLPWLIWTAVYVMQVSIVLLRWKGQYQDLIPAIGLIACVSVPILTLRKTKND